MVKKIGLKILIFLFILLCIFGALGLFATPKTIYTKIVKGFYDEMQNSLDVIFVGDSTIYKGVSPLEIWKEYGITSYDFATPTQRVWDSYYCIKEVFKYQKPKLIVLDVSEFFKETPMKKEYQMHLYGNMKLGSAKIKAINDSVQKNKLNTKFELILPFFRFHSRWTELDNSDITNYNDAFPNIFKGFEVVKDVNAYNKKKRKSKSQEFNNIITKKNKEYIYKIKQLVEDNNAELLLASFPNPIVWNDEKKDEVTKFAKENNFNFINMNKKKYNIDWKQDTGDAGSHLNINGAKKVSSAIGKYLNEKYELKDHRNDEKYKSWNTELEKYEKYLAEN